MADIDITVGLNDRASRHLKNIDRAASSLKNTLRLAAGAAAAFASGAVARGIINQYTQFERYRTVLTTFLGSQTKANEELKRLQQLANNLPQDLADITEAFTIFSRFGLDTSAESLSAFSNIATANAKSFAQLGEAVADALTGEFERLKEFGIKVARENDKFVARIGEDQVAVATSTQDLVRQLQALGEEGGRFGGAAAANADTLNQSFSNLSGAIFEASVNIGEGLRPALKGAVEDLTTMIRQNEELQKSLGVGLGEAIKTSAAGIKLIADNIELVKNAALAYLGLRFANAIVNLTTKVSSAVKATQTLGGMLGTVMKVAMRFITPLRIIGAVVLGAVTAFHFLQDTMFNVGDTMASFGEVVQAIGQIIGDVFAKAFAFVKDIVKGQIENVKNIIVAVPGVITDVGNKIMSGFHQAFSFVRELVFNAITSVRSYIAESSSPVAEAMRRVAQGFRDGFNRVLNTVIASFTQIKHIVTQLPSFFVGAFDGVMSVAQGFGDAIVKKFSNIFEAIKLAGSFEFSEAYAKLGEDTGFSFAESFKKGFGDSGINLMDTSDIFDVDRITQAGDAIKDTYGSASAFVTGVALPALTELKDMTVTQAEVLLNDVKGAYEAVTKTIENKIIANRAELEEAEKLNDMMDYQDHILRIASGSQEVYKEKVEETTEVIQQGTVALSGYEKFLLRIGNSASASAAELGYAMQAKQHFTEQLTQGKISIDVYAEAMDRLNRILGVQQKSTEKVTKTVKESNKAIVEDTKTVTEIIQDKINGMSGSISSTFTDVFLGLKDGFTALEDIALSVVKTIVNTLMEEFLVKPLLKNISQAIGGAFGGGMGGGGLFGGGGMGSLFGLGLSFLTGGFFAEGGNVPTGRKPIVVGEKGPELFLPGRAGQVVPNTDLTGADAGDLTINFNINAIDTQTGTEFIVENKRVITGVIQDAYRRRGSAGPLG